MNGSTLTLSLVGALAVGAAVRRQGSRAAVSELDRLVDALGRFWEHEDDDGDHDPTRVYHGTTRRRWTQAGGGAARWGANGPLHVSADPNESAEYAHLAAQGDRDEGCPYDPRLYLLDLDLSWPFLRDHVILDVDHGFEENVEFQSNYGTPRLTPQQEGKWAGGRAWEVSAQEIGFFVLKGKTDLLKSHFREVPRRKDRSGFYRWPSAEWRRA